MSRWHWYWKRPDDEGWQDECATRAAAIVAAEKEIDPGEAFEIQEGRLSEAKKHWESDFIPFLAARNHECLVANTPPDGAGHRTEAG